MYGQPAYRVRAPPASTPTVAPLAPMAPQIPSALLRSAPSGNMFITIDSAAGSTAAAPRPWTPRMMIRNVLLVASAQPSEAAVNSASPAVNTRLRPRRSAARPPSSKNPPKASAYAVTTHCRSDSAKCRLTPSAGSATLTMSRSTAVMKYARASSENARQRRASPGTAACARPVSFLGSTEVMGVSGLYVDSPHRLEHRPSGRFADEFAPPAVLHCQEPLSRWPREGKGSRMTEAILVRAQAGDGEAFRELIDPYRRELQAHCYRILGSAEDAEDVLQEALLAAWRSIGRFDGQSLRAWMYRIATNRCLNYLRGESRRPQPADLPDQGAGRTGSGEPWWLQPYPDDLGDLTPGPEARYDARESIALSFVAGLQHLPPQQRAVLVLRDVLGFPAAEAAGILGTTQTAVNSALIRARAGLRPDSDPHDVPIPKSPAEVAVVDRFVSAFERFDLDELVALLTDDARLTMPPEPAEHLGPRAIAGFLVGFHMGQDIRLLPTRANGQPALALYLPDPSAPIWRASGLIVLTLRGNQIRALTRFGNLGLLARFGFPRTLPRG